MHYIRLLRPPGLLPRGSKTILSLVLTITTDLGDSFLCPLRPLRLAAILGIEITGENGEKGKEIGPEEQSGGGDETTSHRLVELADLTTSDGKVLPPLWRAGMRVIKLEASLPSLDLFKSTDKARLCVLVAEERLSASSLDHIIGSKDGLVVPVWVDLPLNGPEMDRIALRRFLIRGSQKTDPMAIEVEEELGESIARHVWDAGVMTVAFLADVCSADPSATGHHCMQITKDILRNKEPLHVLELGSGVGILGIGLISVLASVAGRSGMSMMLTDLPDAENRALSNISRFATLSARQTIKAASRIEYANLDWEEGRNGLFAPEVQSSPWDVVILSDCTYNVDMLPALVQTLSALHVCVMNQHQAPGLRVLLATKPRHASEEALFALMEQDGWKMLESVTLPLPVLDAESESVEIYLFGKG